MITKVSFSVLLCKGKYGVMSAREGDGDGVLLCHYYT